MTFKKGFITFLIISIIGTLGHFLYEWTGENALIGLFFPVNESIWEHLKLLFFPTLFYTAVEFFKTEDRKNLVISTAKAVFFGMLLIVTLFYTYSGVLGYKIDFLNILIYYISVAATVIKRSKIFNKDLKYSENSIFIWSFMIIVTSLLFFIWTFYPPDIDLFVTP